MKAWIITVRWLIVISLCMLSFGSGVLVGMDKGYLVGERNGFILSELLWIAQCATPTGKTVVLGDVVVHCGLANKL